MLEQEDEDKLRDWCAEAEENGSHFPGMTYEQGILAMLDVVNDDMSVDELIED